MSKSSYHIFLGQGDTTVANARYWIHQLQSQSQDPHDWVQILSTKQNTLPDDLQPYYSRDLAYPQGTKRIWISPGIHPDHPIFSQFINESWQENCITDIDYFLEHTTAKVILVTGTNGKSTVVSYLRTLLQSVGCSCACYGNFQPGILQAIDQSWDWVIIELSSFQLYWMKASNWFEERGRDIQETVKASILLNISDDHLDWHKGYQYYRQAKHKIFSYSHVCISDHGSYGVSYMPRAQMMAQSRYGEQILQEDLNRSAALECLSQLGFSSQIDGLQSPKSSYYLPHLPSLPYRQQQFILGNTVVINDSKATNMSATLSAITTTRSMYNDKKILLVLAGISKVVDHKKLYDRLASDGKIDVVVVGHDFQDLNDILLARLDYIEDLKMGIISTYGVVLFSPAGTSYDQFKDFKARGSAFDTHIESIWDA